jgi:DNA-binding response OmpR family regulator
MGEDMRLLLIDHDLRLATALAAALRRTGYEVEHTRTAAAALTNPRWDLVLLELALPDEDGLELCRKLRSRGDVAIVVLTGRSAERDRVAALRTGADDYIVKPFSFLELHARLEAVLRRVRPAVTSSVTVGPLWVDLRGHRAVVGSDQVDLTRKEFQLLAMLAREPGTVVHRDRMIAEVWPASWSTASRTLDVHIATLRSKLGGTVLVETVRGVGYRLANAVRP